jgi:hypothetical protein
MFKWIRLLACLGGGLAGGLLATAGTGNAEQFRPTGILKIPRMTHFPYDPRLTSFDIIYVDEATHTVALADRTNSAVDVWSTKSGHLIRQLTGCGGNVPIPKCSVFAGVQVATNASGPNGVITINPTGKRVEVWAGDGVKGKGNSHVVIMDFKTNQVIAKLNQGGTHRADELCYNPVDQVVLIAYDDPADSFLAFMSATRHTTLQKLKLDGKDPNSAGIAANGIEQCQYNARMGKFYLAVPDVGKGTGAVLVISAKAPFKVERVFPIAGSTGCLGPQGLAIGPAPLIQLGCGGENSVIIDEVTGKVRRIEPHRGGADEVWYQKKTNHFFIARSTAGNLGIEDATVPRPSPDKVAITGIGSHTVAASEDGQVFVPIRSNTVGGTFNETCGHLGGNDDEGCIAIYTAH